MSELETSFWPEAISRYAVEVDIAFFALMIIVALLTLPVFIVLPVFVARYRQGSSADRSGRPRQSTAVEAVWGLVPFLLILIIFIWSGKLYFEKQLVPEGALEIDVMAKRWMWKFQHPGGEREINELHVPANRPVVLRMFSQDVIHSLFFPALRLKQDVVPGMTNVQWFEAEKTGIYHLLCTEYCGTSHSQMRGKIIVLEPSVYEDWLARQDADMSLAERGALLYRSYGCSGCHENSDVVRAPSLHGVYGRLVALRSGDLVEADEQYLRDSILLPMKHIVAGYRPVMPSFRQRMPEEDVVQLVAYIKSLAIDDEYRRTSGSTGQ